MPSPDLIAIVQWTRVAVTADAPIVANVRTDEDLAKNVRSLPIAVRGHVLAGPLWGAVTAAAGLPRCFAIGQ